MDPELLTVAETSKALNWSRSAIYSRLISTGTLPVIRLGTSVRIPRRALMEYIERLTEEAENKSGRLP